MNAESNSNAVAVVSLVLNEDVVEDPLKAWLEKEEPLLSARTRPG